MTNIPFFTLDRQYARIGDELEQATLRSLRSTHYILGDEVRLFEKEIEESIGCTAIACANGSDALVLALRALDVGPGDEVITTPFTFVATAGSICRVGATPVFVDIHEDTYNIDEGKIADKISEKTKAIIVVHLYGQMCNMPKIRAIADFHGISVIEDAAQAIGATYDGKPLGAFSDIATYSFFPTKNLGAAGDAGLVTTSSSKLATKLKKLRVHGAYEKYHYDMIGMNSRMDELQAAILRVKLRYINDWNAKRATLAKVYDSQLAPLEGIKPPATDPKAKHVFHLYTIFAEDRDGLQEHLANNNIGSAISYPLALHQQNCFAHLGQQDECPIAARASKHVLCLPLFPELEEKEQAKVCEIIKAFTKQNSASRAS